VRSCGCVPALRVNARLPRSIAPTHRLCVARSAFLPANRSSRRPSSSAAILAAMCQRPPSAASSSAFANAVSTTFDNSYASDARARGARRPFRYRRRCSDRATPVRRRPSGTFVSSAFDAVARGSTCWRQAFVDELDGPLPSNSRVFWRKAGTSRVHEGVIGIVMMDFDARW